MAHEWDTVVELYREGKITFSKETYFGDAVSYRLSGFCGRKRKALHRIILELTESVTKPYGVFSFIRQLGVRGAHEKPCRYESKQGLADDIYEHIQKTGDGAVWRTDRSVVLWSHGCHHGLVRYLDQSCRSRFGIDPYWNGEFYMYGYQNVSPLESGAIVWEQFSVGNRPPDLIVSYREDYPIWIDFLLRNKTYDEEKRICRLVKEACDRHGVKPILKNIDPSMMELGYEV